MDEGEWIYEGIMSQEINMNENTGEEPVVVENIDCSDAFNTPQVLIRFCIWLKLVNECPKKTKHVLSLL